MPITLSHARYEWTEVNQLSAIILLARILDADGALLTQAATTTITYHVIDLDNNRDKIETDTLAKGTVIFDAVQSGDIWPYDDGYNFKWALPADHLPLPRRYVVQITIEPASGEDFWWAYPLDAQRKQSV